MASSHRKSRRFVVSAVVVTVAVALAILAGVAAPSDDYLAFRRAAAVWLVPPPLRRWVMGDGEPATAIRLSDPVGLAEDAAGNLHLADRGVVRVLGVRIGHLIWRIAPDAKAEVIAGTGASGSPEDGQLAREASFGRLGGLAIDDRGRLHLTDQDNHVVMRIEADGRLTRIAGTGRRGDGGDGGPARDASLDEPADVAFDRAGNLFIADNVNHRIRVVAPDGTIATVAGTGTPGYTGDHGPAAEARLSSPLDVHVHPDGRLLIADTGNHVVRQVTPDGIITTLAGTGVIGNGGDGGPAARAQLDAPKPLAVDAAGRIYIGDEHNHNVRVLDRSGVITSVIGDGAPGYALAGAAAAEAPLNDPEGLLVRRDGSLVISDGDTGRVLTLGDGGQVIVVAGQVEHTIEDAMRLFRIGDSEARLTYERRLRAAGLPE